MIVPVDDFDAEGTDVRYRVHGIVDAALDVPRGFWPTGDIEPEPPDHRRPAIFAKAFEVWERGERDWVEL